MTEAGFGVWFAAAAGINANAATTHMAVNVFVALLRTRILWRVLTTDSEVAAQQSSVSEACPTAELLSCASPQPQGGTHVGIRCD